MGITLGEAVSESRGYWKGRFKFRGQRFPILKRIPQRSFYIPMVLLGGLVLGGMIVFVRQGEIFTPVYILISVLLLCATPWPEQFRRYLTPVIPFLLVSLFTCLLAFGTWLRMLQPKLFRKCTPISMIAVLALIYAAELDSLYSMYHYHLDRVKSETYDGKLVDYRLFYYSPSAESLDYGLDWLKKRANPSDVLATSMPHWAFLRTGLKAVRPPLESNPDRAQAFLDSVPVAYIVLNFKGEMQFVNYPIIPLVQHNSKVWKFVYTDEKGLVHIYERVRSEDRNE